MFSGAPLAFQLHNQPIQLILKKKKLKKKFLRTGNQVAFFQGNCLMPKRKRKKSTRKWQWSQSSKGDWIIIQNGQLLFLF